MQAPLAGVQAWRDDTIKPVWEAKVPDVFVVVAVATDFAEACYALCCRPALCADALLLIA